MASVADMRDFAISVLESRYGHEGKVQLLTGQGVQRGTRVKFTKDGKEVTCAIKASTSEHGRIHFAYDETDKRWGTLSDVDYVLYVRSSPGNNNELEAQLYYQATVLDAFNTNREAAIRKGFTNLPPWLSPEAEPHERLTGSGFVKDAIWIETSKGSSTTLKPATPVSSPVIVPAPAAFSPHPIKAAIEAAKDKLAKELGVASNAIEITVRWA